MRVVFRKFSLFLFAFLATLFWFVFWFSSERINPVKSVAKLSEKIHTLEEDLHKQTSKIAEYIDQEKVQKMWENYVADSPIDIHIFHGDSLVFWSSNQLPVRKFSDIHFPSNGLFRLQNGWYLGTTVEENGFLVAGSVLIKHQYAYQNKKLINTFSSALELDFPANISLNQEDGFPVFDKKDNYLFSVEPQKEKNNTPTKNIQATLFLLMIFAWYWVIFKQRKKNKKWLIPIPLIWLTGYIFDVSSLFLGSNFTQSSFFTLPPIFINYFYFCWHLLFVLFLAGYFAAFLKEKKEQFQSLLSLILPLLITFILWLLSVDLLEFIVYRSKINLEINDLFEIDLFTLITLIFLGGIYWLFYRIVRKIIEVYRLHKLPATVLAVFLFLMSFTLLLYEVFATRGLTFAGIFPVVFYFLIFYLVYRENGVKFGSGLIVFLLFCLSISGNLNYLNQQKELKTRVSFAKELIEHKDKETENQFVQLVPKIQKDNFLQRFIASPGVISISDFEEGMERRLFNGFWDRYELEFNLFNEQKELIVEDRKDNGKRFQELDKIINESGVPVNEENNLFFISDQKEQLSYLIKLPIEGKNNENKAMLFVTLKSKKVPEQIGFPRLLISEETNVIQPLEKYSVAKYHNHQLVNSYGEFSFPSKDINFIKDINKKAGFFDDNNFSHYFLTLNGQNVVVISKKNESTTHLTTTFSYLFTFYGFLLLPFTFRSTGSQQTKPTMGLAIKIQLVLILLVFIALLAFGWSSGVFVRNQYNEYNDEVIREKLYSVQTEVKAKLGSFEQLSIAQSGNYIQYILEKFAKVFFTDINLYDNYGHLLGTSRAKVFNIGLQSEQMNPNAFQNMHYFDKSEYVHSEKIGALEYSSAYLPFYNNSGKQLGYINLQHFGQQGEFESQIQRFLVAIINVFILLLAISVVSAIFISNWLTSPLRTLQQNFNKVQFGKHNQKIEYYREDEIGALVKAYNFKLEELEVAADQLAASERESAWREMAKQVAHEIKNPLTPMKLRAQQLLRSFNPNDPKSEEKLRKVSNSMIEQIDALTKIANEFSNFAKMPSPTYEKIELIQLIEGVKQLFEESQSEITISSNQSEIFIQADKNQLLRVFNNLIKNAIQSIPQDREGKIEVLVEVEGSQIEIQVKDNGVGISDEQKKKIFVPYFTTKSGGTGLGLAMVKQIVENHTGQITFSSQKNLGTVFTIVLQRKNE